MSPMSLADNGAGRWPSVPAAGRGPGGCPRYQQCNVPRAHEHELRQYRISPKCKNAFNWIKYIHNYCLCCVLCVGF